MAIDKDISIQSRLFHYIAIFLCGCQFFLFDVSVAGHSENSSFVVAVAAQSCAMSDEEDSEGMVELATAPTRVINKENISRCVKDINEIEHLIHARDTLIIDVRNRSRQISHIDGTIAIPPYAIHGKGFIKNQNLVLLGNGVNDLQLVNECVLLQKNGAKRAYILKGGVRAWEQMKAQSDRVLQLPDKLITAQDAYRYQMNQKWVILTDTVSDANVQEFHKLFPDFQVVTIDYRKDVSHVLTKSKNTNFLVITANGQRYSAISALMQRHKIQNDFYLEGGVAAYRKYISTQRAYLRRMQEKAAKKKTLCGG